MEEINQERGENHLPAPATTAEAVTLDIIRTETVLSRLPVHNLAKKGSINISIIKKTANVIPTSRAAYFARSLTRSL